MTCHRFWPHRWPRIWPQGWRALWQVFLLLPLCALALAASAEPQQRLRAETPSVSMDGRFEHFVDTSNALDFNAVRTRTFTPLTESRSLGYDTFNHWFRVVLDPAPDAPRRAAGC